tara:strand:+ start:498 stop:935 length:438 start_codon:yes stop_codon:yes gene_type:complete
MHSHIIDKDISPYSKKKFLNYKKIKYKRLFYKKFFNKFFTYFNYTFLVLIFLFSFISIDSQRKWTDFYSTLVETRNINNNLLDLISHTEEYYLREIELTDNFKNATSKDLIYLDHPIENPKNIIFISIYKSFINGLKDSKYQIGY